MTLAAGDDVTITTTTTSTESASVISEGKFTTELATDGAGHPVPAGRSAGSDPTALPEADRRRSIPSFPPAVDLTAVGSSCSGSGVNVGPVLASGDGAPNPGDGGPWTFTVSVQNCIGADLGGVKVQGGTSGWTTFGNAVVNAGSYALKTMPGKTRTRCLSGRWLSRTG